MANRQVCARRDRSLLFQPKPAIASSKLDSTRKERTDRSALRYRAYPPAQAIAFSSAASPYQTLKLLNYL
ncbi:hypothetical protein H6F61_22875 [Cyanobacteria bacterium FACHB-472]|nr:hypothetical protein [Cyanobacteria bacterium FACHB-472]